jgi:hypothetical protein
MSDHCLFSISIRGSLFLFRVPMTGITRVDVGAQFSAPFCTPAHWEGAINRAPTLGQIIRAVKAASIHGAVG